MKNGKHKLLTQKELAQIQTKSKVKLPALNWLTGVKSAETSPLLSTSSPYGPANTTGPISPPGLTSIIYDGSANIFDEEDVYNRLLTKKIPNFADAVCRKPLDPFPEPAPEIDIEATKELRKWCLEQIDKESME